MLVSSIYSSFVDYFRTLTKIHVSSPAAQLHIKLGEAHVIRNAGGCAYVGPSSFNSFLFRISSTDQHCFAARRHLGAS